MTPRRKRRRILGPPPRKRVLMALAYYEHRMHLGVVRYAREANWILDTSMAHYGAPPEYWSGDGAVTVALPDRLDLLQYLGGLNVPTVALTADVEGIATARVVLDNRSIGRIAAEHLLERGFRSLAFFKCTDFTDIRDREVGFAGAVRAAGLDYFHLDWHAASRENPSLELFPWLKTQLRKLPKPLGVMAQSDRRAYLLLNCCEAAKLAVPEQVAVVGVDNDEYTCEFAPVPITSVDSNRQELAYQGAALLDRLLHGEPPPKPLVVAPLGLVVRRSSDTLAIEHPEVAKALGFIWRNYQQRIGVEDVVASVAMSRCGLYRAFKEYLGRTIHEELERKRIEHAQRLLLTTTSKVSHIARASGYASGEQFCRAFARVTGSSPTTFRAGKAI